jgi:predicted dehydrogenase
MAKVRWGILSTAKIGIDRVIPGMQGGRYSEITAIASRDAEKARKAAQRLGIPKAYGSYEELLADKEVQAIYNPLPNHLHIPLTLKALEAGKHVLCEKPIGMNLQEIKSLQEHLKNYRGLKVMEAFMYRFHPQWEKIRKIVKDGTIGEMRHVHSIFTYHNVNPADIRNQANIGGGGLLDIGCYCISFSRFLFEREPRRVCGSIELDPTFKTDRLASGILEFEHGTASFSCATQAAPSQRAEIIGSRGRIEIQFPFTPPLERSTWIVVHGGSERNEVEFEPCDQYTLQGDAFSRAILEDKPVPTPLEDAVGNMSVIDAISRSSQAGAWISLR